MVEHPGTDDRKAISIMSQVYHAVQLSLFPLQEDIIPQKKTTILTLTCDQCGKVFERKRSYHRYMTEKRGLTKTFCSSACGFADKEKPIPNSIIEEYQQGLSTFELGKKYGVSYSTIRNRLREAGIPLRHKASHLSTDKNPTKGKGHTEATRKKIRDANHRQFSNPANRALASHNQSKAMAEGRISAVSKLEDRVAQELSNQGFVFTRQYGIRNPHTNRYCACVDFMLSDGRAIEVNGTYWHADPRVYADKTLHPSQKHSIENYQKKIEAFRLLGIPLIELWEMDLEQDMAGTIRKSLAQ